MGPAGGLVEEEADLVRGESEGVGGQRDRTVQSEIQHQQEWQDGARKGGRKGWGGISKLGQRNSETAKQRNSETAERKRIAEDRATLPTPHSPCAAASLPDPSADSCS